VVFRVSLFGRQFSVLLVPDIPEENFFGHLSSVLHSSGLRSDFRLAILRDGTVFRDALYRYISLG
jgi:hypothetical protein